MNLNFACCTFLELAELSFPPPFFFSFLFIVWIKGSNPHKFLFLSGQKLSFPQVFLLRFLVQKSEKVPNSLTKSREKRQHNHKFFFRTVKMSTTSINSRAKLMTSGEIDFRCDLTTNSFFTKWGLENNPEHRVNII